MKVYLTMGRDGRILIQARIEQGSTLGSVLYYVAQGEDFNGIPYDIFAKSTPGVMELPEQPDMSSVQPDMSQIAPEGQGQLPAQPQAPPQAQNGLAGPGGQ